nr:unnamed protein product [Naegleria fowleri]
MHSTPYLLNVASSTAAATPVSSTPSHFVVDSSSISDGKTTNDSSNNNSFLLFHQKNISSTSTINTNHAIHHHQACNLQYVGSNGNQHSNTDTGNVLPIGKSPRTTLDNSSRVGMDITTTTTSSSSQVSLFPTSPSSVSRSSTSTYSLSTLLEERCLIQDDEHLSSVGYNLDSNKTNQILVSSSSASPCLKSGQAASTANITHSLTTTHSIHPTTTTTQKLQLLIPNSNSFQLNTTPPTLGKDSQISSSSSSSSTTTILSFPNSPLSNSSSTTSTPKSNPTTPTTPNRLLNHFPPSQPRSLIEIHLKNNIAFSNVISQKSSTALKSPPLAVSKFESSFEMMNRTGVSTTTTSSCGGGSFKKTSSPSLITQPRSSTIIRKSSSPNPSKPCTVTATPTATTTSPSLQQQQPHHHPLPASINSFILPPCVLLDSNPSQQQQQPCTITTITTSTTTTSVSTTTTTSNILMPSQSFGTTATSLLPSFTNPASLWMKSESCGGGSSSPLKVPSPSRIQSNYIYSPFTYNFIKQNTPSRNARPFTKNAQQKTTTNDLNDEKQAIERLETFYFKKSELLASHLLCKMDHFYRGLLSCIQDILLRLMDLSNITDETVLKKLDRIQCMINLKKYISSRIKDFDEWPKFFDSCITQVSVEDLSRLEDIERCTNNFNVIITGKEELSKNLNLASLKTRLNDHQMFQYITQFVATCCWTDRKTIPMDVMNCLKFFATVPTPDSVDLLKLAKKQDDHWVRSCTSTISSLQDLADYQSDSDDDAPMRDAFSFSFM